MAPKSGVLRIRRIPITDPHREAAREKERAAARDQLVALLVARLLRDALAAHERLDVLPGRVLAILRGGRC